MKTATLSPNECKGYHFDADRIFLCVRWSVTDAPSSRNLVEMREERGIFVAPTTILQWAQRVIPEFETR